MWKKYRKLEVERDEANSSLRRMVDENVELVKRLKETEEQLSRARRDNKFFCEKMEQREQACAGLAAENLRLRDDNKRLGLDRDAAIGKMEEAYAQYRELRDRVETLAHGAEELIEVMIEEMIGAVHGL